MRLRHQGSANNSLLDLNKYTDLDIRKAFDAVIGISEWSHCVNCTFSISEKKWISMYLPVKRHIRPYRSTGVDQIFIECFFENDFKVSRKCINFTLSTNLQYLGAYDKNIFNASGRYGSVAATTDLCSEEGHD